MTEAKKTRLAEIHVKCLRSEDEPNKCSTSVYIRGSAKWLIEALGFALDGIGEKMSVPAPVVAALAATRVAVQRENTAEVISVDLSRLSGGQGQRGGGNG